MNKMTLTLLCAAALVASTTTLAAGKGGSTSTEPVRFYGTCSFGLPASGNPICVAGSLMPGDRLEIQTIAVRCNQSMLNPEDGYPVLDANLRYPTEQGPAKIGIPLTYSWYEGPFGIRRYQTAIEHGPLYAENLGATEQPLQFSVQNVTNPGGNGEYNTCRFEIHGLLD